MARAIATASLLVSMMVAAPVHAEEPDPDEAVALEANVALPPLKAALQTLADSGHKVDARTYLIHDGLLEPPRPPAVPLASPASARVECIIRFESNGNPNAVNPRSGASGLGQFLPSTWRGTPQGKAGLSVFNAAANRAAVGWMLSVGRAREFEVVTRGLC